MCSTKLHFHARPAVPKAPGARRDYTRGSRKRQHGPRCCRTPAATRRTAAARPFRQSNRASARDHFGSGDQKRQPIERSEPQRHDEHIEEHSRNSVFSSCRRGFMPESGKGMLLVVNGGASSRQSAAVDGTTGGRTYLMSSTPPGWATGLRPLSTYSSRAKISARDPGTSLDSPV